MIVSYFRIRNIYIDLFKHSSENGKATFTIEKQDNIYIVANLTKGNVAKYNENEISHVFEYKQMLIVKIIPKQFILVPNSEEAKNLFKNKLIIHNKKKLTKGNNKN